MSSTPEEGMAQSQAGAHGAASAGNVTAREMQRREGGEAHGMQHREGEARARGSAGSGREEKNLDSRYHERE